MTRRARRVDENDDRVAITVRGEIDDLLRVTRSLTLVPEFVSRSRPEPRLLRLDGTFQTLTVHVGQRQHFTRACILHDGGYQAPFVEFQVRDIHLTSTPRPLR